MDEGLPASELVLCERCMTCSLIPSEAFPTKELLALWHDKLNIFLRLNGKSEQQSSEIREPTRKLENRISFSTIWRSESQRSAVSPVLRGSGGKATSVIWMIAITLASRNAELYVYVIYM